MSQATLVQKMRNTIADALPGGERHLGYRNAVFRVKMAFFATLPPQVIYIHVFMWQIIQRKRLSLGLEMELIVDEAMQGNEKDPLLAVLNGVLFLFLPKTGITQVVLLFSILTVCSGIKAPSTGSFEVDAPSLVQDGDPDEES